MPTDQQYAEQIRKETSLFANWLPNSARAIGDFGRVNGALFEYYGRLDPDEIQALGSRSGPSPAGYDIMIHASRALGAKLGGQVDAGPAAGKAMLEIKFSSEKGIVFSAPTGVITAIESMQVLGTTLKQRRLEGNWDMDHAVVVETVTVASATILLSNQRGAQIDFEVAANAPVNAQLMAQLDARASVLDSRGVGIKIIGEGPLTPLFRLAYLKKKILGDPKIVYRQALRPGADKEGAGDVPDPEIHEIDDEHVLAVV